nr:hypothetical protein [Chloroflexota bacterium]
VDPVAPVAREETASVAAQGRAPGVEHDDAQPQLDGWEPHAGARLEPAGFARALDEPADDATDEQLGTSDDSPADREPAAVEPAARGEAQPAGAPSPEPAVLTPMAPQTLSAGPAWPSAGDPRPERLAVARTPAGSYLPPSAFLDALDPAPTAASGNAAALPDAARESSRSPRGLDLRGLFGSLDLADDTPRAVIAGGATVAALGFLLPWANVLAGAGLLGGYFTQWGLAGPGHWIVVVLLLGTVVVALAGAATARWPVGRAAIAMAALLVGLLWPYLFGFLGRSVGAWVVLAGAIVLVVGGLLDGAARHDPEGPPVG